MGLEYRTGRRKDWTFQTGGKDREGGGALSVIPTKRVMVVNSFNHSEGGGGGGGGGGRHNKLLLDV